MSGGTRQSQPSVISVVRWTSEREPGSLGSLGAWEPGSLGAGQQPATNELHQLGSYQADLLIKPHYAKPWADWETAALVWSCDNREGMPLVLSLTKECLYNYANDAGFSGHNTGHWWLQAQWEKHYWLSQDFRRYIYSLNRNFIPVKLGQNEMEDVQEDLIFDYLLDWKLICCSDWLEQNGNTTNTPQCLWNTVPNGFISKTN